MRENKTREINRNWPKERSSRSNSELSNPSHLVVLLVTLGLEKIHSSNKEESALLVINSNFRDSSSNINYCLRSQKRK